VTEWSTVVVIVDVAEADVVSGLLWSVGVAGVEERVFDDDRVELRAGVASDGVHDVRTALGDRWPVMVESVAVDEGLDAWREHAQASRAGDRIVVVPVWQSTPEWVSADDLVLSIDPGHTFGSGSHPTTRMCLVAIEANLAPVSVVADIGCGSGVLSMAAARLGAVRVDAIDIDKRAVAETVANAERNGVAARVDSSINSVGSLGHGRHDLVVANIGAATLVSLAIDLCALVTPGGVLVLSGVLDEQVDAVADAYLAHGFTVRDTMADGEWRALVLRAG
jgi:ribosomal protein L11 methyltransferase